MQVQINTDHNIEGHEALAERIKGVIENSLSRFRDSITRVEVHLRDENSDKKDGYDNMRCMIEARLEGRQPIAVTHQATTLHEAVDGAVDKLNNLIATILGRLQHQESSRTDPPLTDTKSKETS